MSANSRNANAAGKKKGGGFLARQAKARTGDRPVATEEELLDKDFVSPDDVLRLNRITESEYIFFVGFCNVLTCVNWYYKTRRPKTKSKNRVLNKARLDMWIVAFLLRLSVMSTISCQCLPRSGTLRHGSYYEFRCIVFWRAVNYCRWSRDLLFIYLLWWTNVTQLLCRILLLVYSHFVTATQSPTLHSTSSLWVYFRF